MSSQFSPIQNCAQGCVLNNVVLRLDGGSDGVTVDPTYLTVGIYSDGGNQPGSLLYSLKTPTVSISFDENVAFSFTPTVGQSGLLKPDQSYWTRLSTSSNEGIYWVSTDFGTDGARAYQRDNGRGIQVLPSTPWMFEVQASPLSAVPIPGAAWLMGSALAGLGAFVRRKAG